MEEHELQFSEMPEESLKRRMIYAAIAAVVALVSFFLIARFVTAQETNASTLAALDEKRDTVTKLIASSTASSAALSLLPGDLGTPIAEKLVDLSADFLVVLAAIYLEKYLLVIMGHVTFKLLIPVSCVLFSAGVLLGKGVRMRAGLVSLAARLFLFGLAVYLAIPASVFVSDTIERSDEDSINQTIATAEQTAEDIEASSQDGAATSSTSETSTGVGGIVETIQNLPNTLTNTVTGLTEEAQNSLNNFIDALAVMVVTSCVIPILVLLFFLWMVNVLLGAGIDTPPRLPMPRSMGFHRP